ncbi:hypothetical protein [Pyxidicoccus xibeiensis]|uniref:hypothetical protein n=1 Tax=Pyxidicoccus xibeiensis TaxID=2906759 RepID=UPI0020A7F58E|nr:hypothetical protein [Pyxidicoccus xibeiensis]MCP3136656.1 hypothetical protein [Pyxidicoccus xibeiensis]
MPDYTSRADEMLKEIEAIQNKLPEDAARKLREAMSQYLSLRKACLDDLVKLVEDESSSNTSAAGQWRSRCEAVRSALAEPFENALRNLELPAPAAAAGYGWQMGNKVKEEQFFAALTEINVATVRDYLVANHQSLKEYSQTLDEKWKRITSETDTLQSEEQKAYQAMLQMTREIIKKFAEEERTLYEKARQAGQFVLSGAEQGLDLLGEFIPWMKGVAAVISPAAERLKQLNEFWLQTNSMLFGRMGNYQSLVQAERGGILPLFKETRRQVEEYWQKNGLERAREMLNGGKSSLDGWLSACPTPAQKEDARRFYDAAYASLEKHLKNVEAVASEFERKWNGVFKGALSPSVADELIDGSAWRINARTLAEIGTPALVTSMVEKLDGYYEESFEEPLAHLRAQVKEFPEASRTDALRALDEVQKSVESSVRERIKALQQSVLSSLDWFRPGALEKAFSREDLRDALE